MPKLTIVLTLLCVAAPVQASPIFSDSFDWLFSPPAFTTIFNGGTIGPWAVGGNGVDHIGTYWASAVGNGSIDMSGPSAGTLSTTLNTVAGQDYLLTFDLAGNPGGPALKRLEVQVGNINQIFTSDITGHSVGSMGWVQISVPFTAAANGTLTFTSLQADPYGPALDEVTVSPDVTGGVPEPATTVLLGSALAGLGLIGRKRCTR